MKSIRMTIAPQRALRLPLSQFHTLQGLVYELLSFDSALSAELHGRRAEKTDAIKLFCFSDIRGRHRAEGRTLVFTGDCTFEVRSPNDKLIETIEESVADDPLIVINGCECTVTGVRTSSPAFPSGRLDLHMSTPVTVYRSAGDGRRTYYSPEEPEFYEIVRSNLLKKYSLIYGENYTGGLALSPIGPAPYRKVVTRYKGTFINAFYGDLRLEASPQMLAAAYYCGVGGKNSMGFGFPEIMRAGTGPETE